MSKAKSAGIGVGGFIGIILAFVLAGIGLTFLFGGASMLTAPFRGAVDANESIQADGDYRIAVNDQFYEQCSGVVAIERQIKNMQADKSLPEAFKATNILALQNKREALIAQYNADADNTFTRSNFFPDNLPRTINANQETTTCTL